MPLFRVFRFCGNCAASMSKQVVQVSKPSAEEEWRK